MKLLALDTSTEACSVAAANGTEEFERHVVAPKQHTRLLLPMVEEVLKEAELTLSELDAIVLGNGPGSFIGVRIAASVAQGLAFGAGLGIVPVSSLAAVAHQVMVEEGRDRVAVAQDAHMREVYLGLYQSDAGGTPRLARPESLQPVAAIAWPDAAAGDWCAAGAGWQRHPELLEANRDSIVEVSDIRLPRARFLLQPGRRAEALAPTEIAPAYLRSKVAEVPR